MVDRSYRFAARRQGRTLFIEGYVPDERTIEQLLAFARVILQRGGIESGAITGRRAERVYGGGALCP